MKENLRLKELLGLKKEKEIERGKEESKDEGDPNHHQEKEFVEKDYKFPEVVEEEKPLN